MKVGAAIKKIEKALGVKVHHNGDGRYSCQYEKRVLSFIADGDRFSRDDAEAICLRVRREDDHDCYQMDYHAGYFVENISQLISTVKPTAPKYKVGQLIRFKDNKRMKRHKKAGKLGIVLKALAEGSTPAYHIKFLDGSDKGAPSALSWSQRDIEIPKA